MARYRLIPVKRLVTKLGLGDWYHDAPLEAFDITPSQVVLPLRQHIGAPAIPCVTEVKPSSGGNA
jgi:Na+-translocating ferredoxin:NAD+ oxidoreductase RnfC subunit